MLEWKPVEEIALRARIGDVIEFLKPTMHWAIFAGREKSTYIVIHLSKHHTKGYKVQYDAIEELGSLCRINNKYDDGHRSYPLEEVVRRAHEQLDFVGLHNQPFDAITNNCEHFATWCRNGVVRPYQTEWTPTEVTGQIALEGDLIEFYTTAVRHWAIFAGKENNTYMVYHVWATNNEGYKVRDDPMELVAEGRLSRVNNIKDGEYGSFPGYEVLRRAYEQKKRGFTALNNKEYNELANNCEHFARWCRNDEGISDQGDNAFYAILILPVVLHGINTILERRRRV